MKLHGDFYIMSFVCHWIVILPSGTAGIIYILYISNFRDNVNITVPILFPIDL